MAILKGTVGNDGEVWYVMYYDYGIGLKHRFNGWQASWKSLTKSKILVTIFDQKIHNFFDSSKHYFCFK